MSLEIVRHHDAEDLAVSTAARLTTTIVRAQSEYGSASVVLTGGRIAGQLMFALADPVCADSIDWTRLDLWWGDERYLASADPERNDYLADTHLLSRVDINPTRVHRVLGPDSSPSAEAAAQQYATEVSTAVKQRSRVGRPAFDVTLLSIGPDGHVASLFPEQPALSSDSYVLAIHSSPKPPPVRVTMGFMALNSSSEAWLLASGAEKSAVIDMMLTQGAGPLQIPATGIMGQERTLLLIDESAASKLATDIGKR